MKDLFETLIGFEAATARRSAPRSRKGSSYEGEVLRDLMGGTGGEMTVDIDRAISTRSSILEDFDYDRDFEEASVDLSDDTEELSFED